MPSLSMNGLIALGPSRSRAMPMTFACELAATCLSSGISLAHGAHHVAQKFRITTLPLSEPLLTVVPSTDLSEKAGAWLPTLTSSVPGSLAPPQPDKKMTRSKRGILVIDDLI